MEEKGDNKKETKRPFFRFGVICEHILEERDGVLTLVRIIDRLVVSVPGYKLPEKMPPTYHRLKIVASWIGGLGRHEAKVRLTAPDGGMQESRAMSLDLRSVESERNLIFDVRFLFNKEGLYWLDFMLDDEVDSKTPFRVLYKPVEMSPPPIYTG